MGIAMKDLKEQDRPYEKCLSKGPAFLSDAELLAVLLRSGTVGESALNLAMEVLACSRRKNGLAAVMDMSVPELTKIKGIGKIKAVQLKCIAELARRLSAIDAKERTCFCKPVQIADYYMEQLRHESREQLILMMLDIKGTLLHDLVLSVGTVDASLISPREIFVEALKYEAVRIILVHNHPSGNPEPSSQDIEVTKQVEKIGEMIGIPLIDHIIIGDNNYASFRERGII